MEFEFLKKLFDEKFSHFDKRLDRLEEYNRETLKEFHTYHLKHTELNGKVSSLENELGVTKNQLSTLPEDRKTISALQIVQNFFIKLLFITIPVMITLIIQAYFLKKGS